MAMTHQTAIAMRFVDAINDHDVSALLRLMSPAHEFIDTAGSTLSGHDALRQAWADYFKLFPDYRIEIDRVAESGSTVTLVGRSFGTLSDAGREILTSELGAGFDETSLQGSAIWTAEVSAGAVTQWQVHEDSEEARQELGIT